MADESKLWTHVKEQYFWEAQRRDKLNTAASFPIGFATLAGTLISPVTEKVRAPFDNFELAVLFLMAVALIIFSFFIYNVIKFFLGPTYKYVANTDTIAKFWDESAVHYMSYPETGDIDEKFDRFLRDTYSTCATINCENNDKKSHQLYLMNRWVLALLLPCLLAGLMLILSSIFNINSKNINNMEDQTIMADSDQDSSPPPPPPPPPTPPKERSVKDGASVIKRKIK